MRAFEAGNDIDPAFAGRSDRGVRRHQGGGGERADHAVAQLDASVGRVLRAKARSACTRRARVDLDAVPARSAGARSSRDRATTSARGRSRSIKDERDQVPLTAPARRAGAVSVGARLSVGLADRGAEPHVHPRAAAALAERDGDRAVGSHDARRSSNWCARWRRASTPSSPSVFVRASSASGRAGSAGAARAAARSDLARGNRGSNEAVRRGCSSAIRTRRPSCRSCRRCC